MDGGRSEGRWNEGFVSSLMDNINWEERLQLFCLGLPPTLDNV